jgi:hypothetical protein
MRFIDTASLPKICRCYKRIDAQQEKNISFIYADIDFEDYTYKKKYICYKKSDQTTLSYLSSSGILNCPEERKCQKYFCRDEGKKCPVVDVFERNIEEVQSFYGFNYTKRTDVRVYLLLILGQN